MFRRILKTLCIEIHTSSNQSLKQRLISRSRYFVRNIPSCKNLHGLLPAITTSNKRVASKIILIGTRMNIFGSNDQSRITTRSICHQFAHRLSSRTFAITFNIWQYYYSSIFQYKPELYKTL